HPRPDPAGAQPLRQAESVARVVLLSPALLDAQDNDLVDVRRQDLVQPRALRPLLEANVAWPRDRLDILHQCLAVRLHHVRAQPLAARAHDRHGRACGVHIQANIAVHWRPPPWVLLSATKTFPLRAEGASSSARQRGPPRSTGGRKRSGSALGTPPFYDAY